MVSNKKLIKRLGVAVQLSPDPTVRLLCAEAAQALRDLEPDEGPDKTEDRTLEATMEVLIDYAAAKRYAEDVLLEVEGVVYTYMWSMRNTQKGRFCAGVTINDDGSLKMDNYKFRRNEIIADERRLLSARGFDCRVCGTSFAEIKSLLNHRVTHMTDGTKED